MQNKIYLFNWSLYQIWKTPDLGVYDVLSYCKPPQVFIEAIYKWGLITMKPTLPWRVIQNARAMCAVTVQGRSYRIGVEISLINSMHSKLMSETYKVIQHNGKLATEIL